MIIVLISTSYAAIYMAFSPYIPKFRVITSLMNASVLSLYALHIYASNGTLMSPYNDTILNDIITGYFLYDTVIGMSLDHKNFDPLTGLAHHVVYICLLRYLRLFGYSNLICPFLPFEIPSVLLDIRKLHRTALIDSSFGLTFFLFRILYNLFLIQQFYSISVWYAAIVSMMFVVHCIWFKTWAQRITQN